jgi:tetratricopeptide (TPR) repeat protein
MLIAEKKSTFQKAIKYLFICLLLLPLTFVCFAQTQVEIAGFCITPLHEPLANVEVRVIGGGRDFTTTSGEFRIKVTASRIGQRITLQVIKRGWTVIKPNDLQVIVPSDPVQNPITITMKSKEIVGSLRPKAKTRSSGARRSNKSQLSIEDGDSQSKFVVLVANFKSIGEQGNAVTETIISKLRAATKEYSDIDIQALGKEITVQQGSKAALAIAKERKASIILWGWYSQSKEKFLMNANFEVLQKPKNFELKQASLFTIIPISEIQTFSIHLRLSSKMSYLTLLTTGLARLDAKDYKDAIDHFTKALELPSVPDQMVDPSDLYRFRGKAWLDKYRHSFSLKVDLDKAIADLTQAITINSKNAKALTDLAFAYWAKDDLEQAITNSSRAADVATDPVDRFVAYFLLCSLYLMEDDQDKVHTAIEQGLRISYELPFPGSLVFTPLFMMIAEDYDKALIHLNQAIASSTNLDPKVIVALLSLRGACYNEKKDYAKALKDYNRAVMLVPRYAKSYIYRGRFYEENKKPSQAVIDYTKAIKIDPKDLEAYKARAEIHNKSKDYEKAIADYNAILKLSPQDYQAYMDQGHCYESKGDLDRALYDYDFAVQLRRESASPYLRRGRVYELKKQMGKAISDYSQAIKLRPDLDSAYLDRGRAYALMGNVDNAIADLTVCIKLYPSIGDGYFYRGLSYAKKNERALAIADLKTSLMFFTLDPKIHSEAELNLRKLGVIVEKEGPLGPGIIRDPDDFPDRKRKRTGRTPSP